MDQGPLVDEEIHAGAELIAKFHEYMPVKAAFWLKPSEEGRWSLYIASDQINDTTLGLGYGEVLRLTQGMRSPYLDPFQVKLIPTDDPLASAVLDVHRRFGGKLSMHYRGTSLGGRSIEGAFLYRLPETIPSQSGG